MPTNRTRKTRDVTTLTDPAQKFLKDEYDSNSDNFEIFLLDGPHAKDILQRAWYDHKENILSDWISKRPGTRPSLWYQFTSPRQANMGTDFCLEGKLPAYRRVIQGEAFPTLCTWRYKGIAMIHSDADILVESECSFLRRHTLLTTDEAKKLKPEDFEKTESFFSILEERKRIKPY